jgi:hypothetical protein
MLIQLLKDQEIARGETRDRKKNVQICPPDFARWKTFENLQPSLGFFFLGTFSADFAIRNQLHHSVDWLFVSFSTEVSFEITCSTPSALYPPKEDRPFTNRSQNETGIINSSLEYGSEMSSLWFRGLYVRLLQIGIYCWLSDHTSHVPSFRY